MWLCSSLAPLNIFAYLLPMVLFSTALGLVLPNSMAIAMRPFPTIAGTASALLGFIQMSVSALASALVGTVLSDTPRPMVLTMVGICLAALLLNVMMYQRLQHAEH
jgi:DHA1 family bicyclomycin/chloramphenicol resistance-like MFS transporter